MAGQARRFFLFRDRPEAVDADEVSKSFKWIQLAGIVFHDQAHHCTPDRAKRKGQLVVRDRHHGPAVERVAVDDLLWLLGADEDDSRYSSYGDGESETYS